MSAKIYDTTQQAFVDADTPKVFVNGVATDTEGRLWNGSAFEDEAWSAGYVGPNGELIPVMTSNTTPFGEVTYGKDYTNYDPSNTNWLPYYGFDGVNTTRAMNDPTVTVSEWWLAYTFPNTVNIGIVKYLPCGDSSSRQYFTDTGGNAIISVQYSDNTWEQAGTIAVTDTFVEYSATINKSRVKAIKLSFSKYIWDYKAYTGFKYAPIATLQAYKK